MGLQRQVQWIDEQLEKTVIFLVYEIIFFAHPAFYNQQEVLGGL